MRFYNGVPLLSLLNPVVWVALGQELDSVKMNDIQDSDRANGITSGEENRLDKDDQLPSPKNLDNLDLGMINMVS